MEWDSEFGGLDLDSVYDIAHQFLADKIEKAFHPTYDERVNLSALSLQSKYGKYDSSRISGVGWLDFAGQKRISRWQALGEMPQEAAKTDFVRLIKQLCPMFQAYVQAYARQVNAKEMQHVDVLGATEHESSTSSEHSAVIVDGQTAMGKSWGNSKNVLLQNEREIRSALNIQTKDQFEAYARLHYPDDPKRQSELIAELQDRHFCQYIQFIERQGNNDQPVHSHRSPQGTRVQQIVSKPGSVERVVDEEGWIYTETPSDQVSCATNSDAFSAKSQAAPTNDFEASSPQPADQEDDDRRKRTDQGKSSSSEDSSMSLVPVPSMWTRSEIDVFKDNLSRSKDAVFPISCGETITIRLPTHSNGNCVFWEFATDHYDLGFGLSFEWLTNMADHMSDQVEMDAQGENVNALEQKDYATSEGSPSTAQQPSPRLVEEIIPMFRRNCHLEVYCGTHSYPGPGTYLFQFDNSYSLWRSKVLYFRGYYTC